MRSSQVLALLAAMAPLVLADVKFTVPAAGASLTGGSAITVTWTDTGDAPAIADLTSYQLFLYTGGNDAPGGANVPQQLAALVPSGLFSAGNTASVTIDTGVGGPGTNAYFLGMISTATAGGTVTNFSNRFTLTGMVGTFSAAVTTALAGVSGTAGPSTINNVAAAAPAAGASSTVAEGVWGTPYNEQEGLTKYAPMQPVPPTQITATNTSPLWPTSSVPTATTFLPIPSQVTTMTQPPTYSIASHPNTAATQSSPTPSNDMQRFLNRWKD